MNITLVNSMSSKKFNQNDALNAIRYKNKENKWDQKKVIAIIYSANVRCKNKEREKMR